MAPMSSAALAAAAAVYALCHRIRHSPALRQPRLTQQCKTVQAVAHDDASHLLMRKASNTAHLVIRSVPGRSAQQRRRCNTKKANPKPQIVSVVCLCTPENGYAWLLDGALCRPLMVSNAASRCSIRSSCRWRSTCRWEAQLNCVAVGTSPTSLHANMPQAETPPNSRQRWKLQLRRCWLRFYVATAQTAPTNSAFPATVAAVQARSAVKCCHLLLLVVI